MITSGLRTWITAWSGLTAFVAITVTTALVIREHRFSSSNLSPDGKARAREPANYVSAASPQRARYIVMVLPAGKPRVRGERLRLRNTQPIGRRLPAGHRESVYLWAEPDVVEGSDVFPAMRLVVVNPTSKPREFRACDRHLYIAQEAMNQNGDWQPIETTQTSTCGNSYYFRPVLPAGNFWSFGAPRYRGRFRTQLRFRLSERDGDDLVSNTFWGSINLEQFVNAR